MTPQLPEVGLEEAVHMKSSAADKENTFEPREVHVIDKISSPPSKSKKKKSNSRNRPTSERVMVDNQLQVT